MQPKELNALLSLLDDPDEVIFTQVKDKIVSLGQDIIPALENVWEHSFDTLLQTRIEDIIHAIHFQKIAEDLRSWARVTPNNLLEGALLVATYLYPELDRAKIHRQIEQIKQDVWLELNDNLTALEKTKVINHILFDVHGFSGNTTNYYDPQNNFINIVLESKKGNPASLSLLYAIIAQELHLPIFGVNLPEHFVLAYQDAFNEPFNTQLYHAKRILFYINPFSRGAVFSRKEIDAFLKQLEKEAEENYYLSCSNLETIKCLIKSLITSYKKSGKKEKSKELESLLKGIELQD